MSTLATFDVVLRADLRDFAHGMTSAGKTASSFMSNVASSAAGFLVANVAMRGFSMAVAAGKEALFGYNARMEQASIGFTTLLGSAEKAASFIEELKDFAKKTPFDFPGLQKSANLMLAMGFKAKDILPTLTAVGDATAALGFSSSEGVQRAVYALGQMRAAGKFTGQDMMQLTTIGIPAWQLLADSIGKSIPETKKLAQEGLIPVEKGIKGILREIEQGNMGGMMKAQAQTFSGAMSTVKDAIHDLTGTAMKPLFEAIRDLVVPFSTWIADSKQAQGLAEGFAAGLTTVITKAREVGTVLLGLGRGAIEFFDRLQRIRESFGTLTALQVLGQKVAGVFRTLASDVGAALADLGARIRIAIDPSNLNGIVVKLQELGATLMTIDWMGIVDTILSFRGKVINAFLDIVDQVAPVFSEFLNNLATQLPSILDTVAPVLLELASKMATGFMEMIGHAVQVISDNTPQIVAAISNFLQAAFDWLITTGVPMAANAIGPLALKFVDWVFEVLPKLLDALDEIIGAIIDFVVRNAPVLAGKLLEWAGSFIGWIATEVVPRLIANLPTILRTILLFLGGAAVKIVGRVAKLGVEFIGTLMGWLGQIPGKVAFKLGEVIGRVILWIGQMIGKAAQAGRDFVGNVMKFLGELPGKVASWAVSVITSIGRFITNLQLAAGKAGRDFVNGIINGLKSLPGRLWDAIVGAFKSIFPIRIGPITIGMNGISIQMPDIKLPSFATGLWRVPQDMAALIHRDEMIVPADIASRLRGEGSSSASAGARTLPTATGMSRAVFVNAPLLAIGNYYAADEDPEELSRRLATHLRTLLSTS